MFHWMGYITNTVPRFAIHEQKVSISKALLSSCQILSGSVFSDWSFRAQCTRTMKQKFEHRSRNEFKQFLTRVLIPLDGFVQIAFCRAYPNIAYYYRSTTWKRSKFRWTINICPTWNDREIQEFACDRRLRSARGIHSETVASCKLALSS